jgi:hypothetical protein
MLDLHPKYREHQEGGPERRLQAGQWHSQSTPYGFAAR